MRISHGTPPNACRAKRSTGCMHNAYGKPLRVERSATREVRFNSGSPSLRIQAQARIQGKLSLTNSASSEAGSRAEQRMGEAHLPPSGLTEKPTAAECKAATAGPEVYAHGCNLIVPSERRPVFRWPILWTPGAHSMARKTSQRPGARRLVI